MASRRGTNSVRPRAALNFDPTVDASVEHVERQRTAGEDLVMERLEVELAAKLLFRAFAQLADLELPELVAAGLTRPGNVPIGLSLDRGLVNRVGLAHVFHHLIAAPIHVVNTGVYH